jgi:hypothetical protein
MPHGRGLDIVVALTKLLLLASCFAINPNREFSSQIDASLEGEKSEGTIVHVD